MDREQMIIDSMKTVDPINTEDLKNIFRYAVLKFLGRTGYTDQNQGNAVGALEVVKHELLQEFIRNQELKIPHQRDFLGES